MFNFSALNHAMISGTPTDTLNIHWNSLNEKMQANAYMYMTPMFNFSASNLSPMGSSFNPWSLNPFWVAQQTMNNFPMNGNWMNGMQSPWQMPWMNNSQNNNSDNGTTTEQRELKNLRELLTKYKELANNTIDRKDPKLPVAFSTETLDVVTEALKKSGTTEERLKALKEAYKKLNPKNLTRALMELESNEIEFSGLNINKSTNDKKLSKSLNKIDRELKAKTPDSLNSLLKDETNQANIMQIISSWNDTHKEDTNRGIIRLIAENLPNKNEQVLHRENVDLLATALINKADDVMVDSDKDYSGLEADKKALSDKLIAVMGHEESDGTKTLVKSDLMELANAFDKLYAHIRMVEAENIRNSIGAKFSFLNNISENDTNIITDDLIVKDVKKDLEAEGLKDIPTVDELPEVTTDDEADGVIDGSSNEIDETATAIDQMKQIVKQDKTLKSTNNDNVFQTVNAPTKFYAVNNEQIVELKGVESYNAADKTFRVKGSTTPMTLEQILSNASNFREVNATEVQTYAKTTKRLKYLTSGNDAALKQVNTSNMANWPKNIKLYVSKGYDEEGNKQYFIIKGNDLVMIKDAKLKADGTFDVNGATKKLTHLSEDNFTTFDNDEIATTNRKKEAETKADKERSEKYEKQLTITSDMESDDAKQIGKDIATDLMGVTDGWFSSGEWGQTIDNIKKINSDNVYGVIKAYAEEEGWGTDHILEQIQSENTGTEEERLELVNHIIKTVLEFCDKNGSKSPDSYEELDKYRNGIEIGEFNSSLTRKLDHYILRMFGIRL